MTTIALAGSSPVITALRDRLERSPIPFELVDSPADADLTVTDRPAPSPNYLGVAAAQTPSIFYCRDETLDYVTAALTEAHLGGTYGVRVRPPVQASPDRGPRPRWWRRPFRPLDHFDPSDFDWDTAESVEPEVFDDDVHVVVGDQEFTARLRARGRVDGNDGHFHWAGILYGDHAPALKAHGKSRAQVRLGDGDPVPAKLAEVTPWGTVRMTGVGVPPWAAQPVTR